MHLTQRLMLQFQSGPTLVAQGSGLGAHPSRRGYTLIADDSVAAELWSALAAQVSRSELAAQDCSMPCLAATCICRMLSCGLLWPPRCAGVREQLRVLIAAAANLGTWPTSQAGARCDVPCAA